ncbi:transmembrane protein 53 [Tanacetum coccineum]
MFGSICISFGAQTSSTGLIAFHYMLRFDVMSYNVTGDELRYRDRDKGPVVVLGWLGSQQKHLRRKLERRVEELCQEVVEWVEKKEEDGRERVVMFHTSNNTGWLAGYYLADGIYPTWATFVKTYTVARTQADLNFELAQESARKDVEVLSWLLVSFRAVRGL